VVGLATARALAIAGYEVLILDRESVIGSGISSRNSEVIHAGIYYPHGSLKAKLCTRGRNLLYEYCKERHIPHERKGKIIVATTPDQLKNDIPKILSHAKRNGVNDLHQLSGIDVRTNFEPEISCYGALYSPSTGILDSHSYMVSLLAEAEEHGVTLALNANVENISVLNSRDIATADGRISVHADGMILQCDNLINCSGLYSGQTASWIFDSMKEMNHNSSDFDKRKIPCSRQYYAKGNYFRLDGQKSPFEHLVYPIPEPGGLGIHATVDLNGNTRFGPDVEWIDKDIQDPSTISLRVDPARAELFHTEVKKYWPLIQDGALVPDYSGVRPKRGHPDCLESPSVSADFHIEGFREHGVKGFVNLLGIESPGLTSSMKIAEMVVKLKQAQYL